MERAHPAFADPTATTVLSAPVARTRVEGVAAPDTTTRARVNVEMEATARRRKE